MMTDASKRISLRDRAVLSFEAAFAGRVDKAVGAQFPEASRKRLAQLFSDKQVRVEGKQVKKGYLVREGQKITLDRLPLSDVQLHAVAQDVPLEIVYEDEHLVALVKPQGTPSYPHAAGELGTLANALVARFPECARIGNDPREAGLAHRLDTDTSGLLLAARSQECWQALRDLFFGRQVRKTYLAVVQGRPIGKECEEEILQDGKRVRIDYAGLEAYTSWEEVTRTDDFTLLRCQAHTGRMHQIRAHLAHCGSPIAGDTLYDGHAQEDLHGHFLHASELFLPHPMCDEELRLKAPLPEDRKRWMESKGLKICDATREKESTS